MSATSRRANGEGSKPIQRKDGRWQIAIRYTDSEARAKRTTVTGSTPSEAREKAEDIRKRLKAELPPRDSKATVSAFASSWIATSLAASDRKLTTKDMYATVTRKHIVDSSLGVRTLDKLKPSHIEGWIIELRDRGLSQSTIRSAYTVLRAILDAAVRDDLLAVNPTTKLTRPKVEKQEAYYLTTDQVKSLLEHSGGTRYRLLFELLANTGLRRGEALALRWSDVDFDKKTIDISGTLGRIAGELVKTSPKSKKSARCVKMSPGSERVLRAARVRQAEERLKAGSLWSHTGYVFTTELGEPCDPRNALRAIKATARKTGLEDIDADRIGLHTLRHSAASVMINRGTPLKVVQQVLGHSSISITGDIYGHVFPESSAEALDTLSMALGS